QNEFANQMVPNFLKEAQALGITKDELVKIIEGGFQ
ncbi:MAG: GntR family transcriptional regulator, partial [Streptococcus sp.]|nr:GntR family transcriptional regulator [Streptococcus sp.]